MDKDCHPRRTSTGAIGRVWGPRRGANPQKPLGFVTRPGGATASPCAAPGLLRFPPMLRILTLGPLLGLLLATAGCASSRATSLEAPNAPPSPASASTATPRETVAGSGGGEASPAADATGGAENEGSSGAAGSTAAVAAGEARTPEERRDVLDQKLGASLQAFDAMLLKEQQQAAQERAANAATGASSEGGQEGEGGGAAGAGSAAAPAGDRGQQAGRDGSTRRSGNGGREDARPSGAGAEGERDRSEGRTAGAPGTESSEGAGAVPPDVGDGRDDDLVARQIREAAMKEQDPAIREKLWEEYRRYKASQPGGGA